VTEDLAVGVEAGFTRKQREVQRIGLCGGLERGGDHQQQRGDEHGRQSQDRQRQSHPAGSEEAGHQSSSPIRWNARTTTPLTTMRLTARIMLIAEDMPMSKPWIPVWAMNPMAVRVAVPGCS